MYSLTSTLTVATVLLTASLTSAVPHARQHLHLHRARAAELEVSDASLAGRRSVPGTVQLSAVGVCGGSSGYGCAEGFCCSKWGYCGTTEEYCGNGGSNGTEAWPSGAPAGGSVLPSGWGQPTASGYGGSPSTSAAAAGSSAAAPTPSGYSAPPSAPTSAPASAPASPSASAPASPPTYSSPAASAAPSGSSGGGFSGYKMYSGDGSASAGWPSMDQWIDFETAWTASVPIMKSSCANITPNNAPNDSDEEISEMKSAVQSAASQYGVDSRFILAIMMQESNGCVRVQTTANGVTNPGLFQSHDGSGSCNTGTGTDYQVPCPESEITQMVQDGVHGTSSGQGLQQILAGVSTSGAQAYYQTAVIYNSGNLPANLDDNTATPCYASDVANRLTGWTQGVSGCSL